METKLQSITVNRPLVERLQTLICCSGTKETCRDDDFCSSSLDDWPLLSNGTVKTRFTYPSDPEKPSVADVPNFCSDYLDWYTETNCGPLAKEVAMRLSSTPRCAAGADPQAYISRILRQVPPASRSSLETALQEELRNYAGPASQQCIALEQTVASMRTALADRCTILYDDRPDGKQFNPDRAEDLNNLAEFCRMVGSSEQQRLSSIDPDRFRWKDVFQGGGIAAGAVGIAYALFRAVKTILNIARGATEADETLNAGAKSLKHFFGVTLRNIGRSMQYVFSFGWLRGKEPPPDVAEPSDPPEQPPAATAPPIEIHVHPPAPPSPSQADETAAPPPRPKTPPPQPQGSVVPHPDVVRAQFANLTSSDHYSQEGVRFNNLTDLAKRYLSHYAIDLWNQEPPERRDFLSSEDNRLTEGKLPIDFLREVVRRFLTKQEMLSVIEVSARVWQERTLQGRDVRRMTLFTFDSQPSLEEVERQLFTHNRYSHLSAEAREYSARKLITRWDALRSEEKLGFIGPRDGLEHGALPWGFLRAARRRELRDLKELEWHGRTVVQLIREVPGLSSLPLPLLERRAMGLLSAWEALPGSIQETFRALDDRAGHRSPSQAFPSAFVRNMHRTLRRTAAPRGPLQPAPEPWDAGRAEQKLVDGYDLRELMRSIVRHNGPLASYPAELESRARTILEGWRSLDADVRRSFTEHEDAQRAVSGLPRLAPEQVPSSYVRLWSAMSQGVGVTSREASEATILPFARDPKKGGPSGTSGSGSPAGGMPTGGGGAPGAQAGPAGRGSQRLSFGGITFAQTAGEEDASGIGDTQRLTRDEMDEIISGAAVMTYESAASSAVPLVAPAAAGMGTFVK